jgi:hypothetical protein
MKDERDGDRGRSHVVNGRVYDTVHYYLTLKMAHITVV